MSYVITYIRMYFSFYFKFILKQKLCIIMIREKKMQPKYKIYFLFYLKIKAFIMFGDYWYSH